MLSRIGRGAIVAFVPAAMLACGGQSASKEIGGTSDASANDVAVSSEVAARACSPLAPPSSLTLEAVTADGHYLVETTDPSTAVTHLFYGTPDHMIEARITRTDVNCAWSPTFEAGGETYDAVIAYTDCGTAVSSRIFVGKDPTVPPMALTMLRGKGVAADAGATASPDTFAYSCF